MRKRRLNFNRVRVGRLGREENYRYMPDDKFKKSINSKRMKGIGNIPMPGLLEKSEKTGLFKNVNKNQVGKVAKMTGGVLLGFIAGRIIKNLANDALIKPTPEGGKKLIAPIGVAIIGAAIGLLAPADSLGQYVGVGMLSAGIIEAVKAPIPADSKFKNFDEGNIVDWFGKKGEQEDPILKGFSFSNYAAQHQTILENFPFEEDSSQMSTDVTKSRSDKNMELDPDRIL